MLPDTHRAEPHQEEHDGRSPAFAPLHGATLDKVATRTNISDLKHGEPKPHQDEDELRRIVDLIPQYLVLDAGGIAIFANRQTLEYTGLSLEEVSAGEFRERVFHPDDVERLREERKKRLAGAIPFQNEQRRGFQIHLQFREEIV
jgi:PAS domain S-box-containing protein